MKKSIKLAILSLLLVVFFSLTVQAEERFVSLTQPASDEMTVYVTNDRGRSADNT